MKYQLILQWPFSSLGDYEEMIRVENALIETFGDHHKVDGHDEGSGEMNVFVWTDDPNKAFDLAQSVLANTDVWKRIRIAYRETLGSTYTILWPKELARFKVT